MHVSPITEIYPYLPHSRAKRPEHGSFRLFWYSLYISSPNMAYELALCSRLFRHQYRHKIFNADVTNIFDIKLLFSTKKSRRIERPWREELNAENHSSLWQKLRELWQVNTKLVVPYQAILFLKNQNPQQFFSALFSGS